jgi:phosphoribosylaminoimidazole-succinocarboxamide synthase
MPDYKDSLVNYLLNNSNKLDENMSKIHVNGIKKVFTPKEKEIIKEAESYLNSLTREELKKVLSSAGFEVEDGEAKVIFTGEEE